MLWKNIQLIVVMALLLVALTVQVNGETQAWHMVYGDVVRIFPEQQKILLESGGQKSIFVLADDCVILRFGKPSTFEALRPIAPGVYQDALCWVNSHSLLAFILVNYSVVEVDGVLISYDIFGNPK